ncbi:50S ribosomal protein L17 [Fulvivirga sp. M361]|uniref:50S ribosomal protein L17 n=1 Tax=Fulvivirga sp. M361 TaxID=2594266 RepID=UPI00117B062C|nr:50S ribosomal protein L17 [Fulvivirga sp. M361]TRX53769.1 50S ribosomal protein L17 [Fulvivirga sp. M361]
MRHGKKFNHLGRTAPHRKAMLSNMATSLILNKRISTTLAKAKALRKFVEPILTKAKDDTTHSRRVAFSYLNDKESVKTLFDEVATKIADRPGGYTRILKTGNRLGDNADMCIIELVDYNELLLDDAPKKSKTRRSRRGKKSSTPAPAAEVEATEVVEVSEAEVIEENTAEAVVEEAETDTVEEVEVQAEAVVQEENESEAEASSDTEDSNDEKEDKDDSEKKN